MLVPSVCPSAVQALSIPTRHCLHAKLSSSHNRTMGLTFLFAPATDPKKAGHGNNTINGSIIFKQIHSPTSFI